MAQLVTLEDVRAASRTLEPIVFTTPYETSGALSDIAGSPVLLKCENLQRSGSFKVRGAYVRMANLSPNERDCGVVAGSAGNHAQGVALAARELGIDATVFMPTDAALPKVAATRDYGARVELVGANVAETLAAAQEHARFTGATFIHPFDHPDIVAGQGTLGLEILEQVPDAGAILVPTGGGGLLAGVAVAAKALRPDVLVIGVQAERAAAYPGSIAAGQPLTVEPSTMADGIAVASPGEVPFALISELVDAVVTVSEAEISRALLFMVERAKLIVEPAGVVGVAAILSGALRDVPGIGALGDRPIIPILSGGNIDPILLLRVLRHGLSVAGRFIQMRIWLRDRPGALRDVVSQIALSGANIMHVGHVRAGVELDIDEVEITVQLETKGPAHADQVVKDLTDAGYVVSMAQRL